MKKNLLLIAGVSGSGKSHFETELKANGFCKAVTTTTRPQRDGEVGGVHYHFSDVADFEQKISNGDLVEFAMVGSNYYGMDLASLNDLAKKNSNLYIILDPQGVKAYQEYFADKDDWQIRTLFIDCPVDLRSERVSQRIGDESSFEQIFDVMERLLQTRSCETEWRSMVSYDLYCPVSRTSQDTKTVSERVIEAFNSRSNGFLSTRVKEPVAPRQRLLQLQSALNLELLTKR